MDARLRLRVLLVLFSGLLAWLVWGQAQRASEELTVALQAQTQSDRESARAAREGERRERLHLLSERLEGRAVPPTSAPEVREFLVWAADRHGVELSQVRLQPVVRPPEGTQGAEAAIALLGDPGSLSGFLGAVDGNGWPLRTERATLAVRGGLGTLTATVLVLWPDPAATFTPADAYRLADDPRLEQLALWLESTSRPEPVVPLVVAEPIEAEPAPVVDVVEESAEPLLETVTAPAPEFEAPELHGFVDVGSGTPIRAALFYRGETTLVGVGDRVGDYTVVTLEPSEAVVLSRAAGPPLRLVLR